MEVCDNSFTPNPFPTMPNASAVINDYISNGQSLIGLSALTPVDIAPKTSCRTSQYTEVYIPVVIKGIKIDGSTTLLEVEPNFDAGFIFDNAKIYVVPSQLYLTIADIKATRAEEEHKARYQAELSPFHHGSRATIKRDAFADLYNRAPREAQKLIDRECKENKYSNISKIPLHELKDLATLLAKAIYYPALKEDEEPEEDYDDYE